jgi:ABC-type polysaccharide/polyol phosphate transport system ATPase subunit
VSAGSGAEQRTPVADVVGGSPSSTELEVVTARANAIEVRDLRKSFEIPYERVDSIKERVAHPFAQPRTRALKALNGISFDVHQGEFFGIVGRNGTGKSTLLKILASIYRADAGKIAMAGRVAPFIELGVGFNVELTARENIVLNGVLMGLSKAEAESRIEAVIEFAELEEFADLKLKNYSSGMLVRLAFSVMIQSDADILLIDEVLAVGDASFQQKCKDVFHDIRGSGRTVVLVTHDMSAVEQYCHRAMLLDRGEIKTLGDPAEVARAYLRLNFERAPTSQADGSDDAGAAADVRIVDAWLAAPGGGRTDNVELGAQVEFHATFEAQVDVPLPTFGFTIANDENRDIFGFGSPLHVAEGAREVLRGGERAHFKTRIDNRLAPGRYVVKCWVHRNYNFADLVVEAPHVLDFVVFGTHRTGGIVALAEGSEAVIEEGP